jgi:hypothetical protein
MDATGKILSAGSQTFRGKLAADRIPGALIFCRAMFARMDPSTTIALERAWLAHGRKADVATLDMLAEFRGRLIGLAESMGHEVRLVHPSEWRAWIGIRANTPRAKAKDMAIHAARRMLPAVGTDDDLAEATLIASYVLGQIRGEKMEARCRPA